MSVNHHNHDYYTDPNSNVVPIATGDRYYGQDLGRDFWSLADYAARMHTQEPLLGYGGKMEYGGSGVSHLNISAGGGWVKYDVTVPDDISSRPGTTKTETVWAFVAWPDILDLALSTTGATLDGTTRNYIKIAFNDADRALSRQRARAAGTYNYEKQWEYDLTIDSSAPTDYEVCVGVLRADGSSVFKAEPYTSSIHGMRVACPYGADENDLMGINAGHGVGYYKESILGTLSLSYSFVQAMSTVEISENRFIAAYQTDTADSSQMAFVAFDVGDNGTITILGEAISTESTLQGQNNNALAFRLSSGVAVFGYSGINIIHAVVAEWDGSSVNYYVSLNMFSTPSAVPGTLFELEPSAVYLNHFYAISKSSAGGGSFHQDLHAFEFTGSAVTRADVYNFATAQRQLDMAVALDGWQTDTSGYEVILTTEYDPATGDLTLRTHAFNGSTFTSTGSAPFSFPFDDTQFLTQSTVEWIPSETNTRIATFVLYGRTFQTGLTFWLALEGVQPIGTDNAATGSTAFDYKQIATGGVRDKVSEGVYYSSTHHKRGPIDYTLIGRNLNRRAQVVAADGRGNGIEKLDGWATLHMNDSQEIVLLSRAESAIGVCDASVKSGGIANLVYNKYVAKAGATPGEIYFTGDHVTISTDPAVGIKYGQAVRPDTLLVQAYPDDSRHLFHI